MGAPSDKKRLKQKQRAKQKHLAKVANDAKGGITSKEKSFGKTQIAIIGVISLLGALFVILKS
jgi:hypothetical protein